LRSSFAHSNLRSSRPVLTSEILQLILFAPECAAVSLLFEAKAGS
jgi:hypothetical protein